MRIRNSFVTNSSSASYILSNLSNEILTLDEFLDIIWDKVNCLRSKENIKKEFNTFFMDCFPVPPDTKYYFTLDNDDPIEWALIEYFSIMNRGKIRNKKFHIDCLSEG